MKKISEEDHKKFNNLLSKLHRVHEIYREFYKEAEDQFESFYGVKPEEIDLDKFFDAYVNDCKFLSSEDIETEMIALQNYYNNKYEGDDHEPKS